MKMEIRIMQKGIPVAYTGTVKMPVRLIHVSVDVMKPCM